MTAGRPTLYDPTLCETVLALGEQGMSVVEMAAYLKVHRSTLEVAWPEAHPEFSEAFTQAKQASQAWWERQGRVMLVMKPGEGTFNTGVWSRSMAARFPEDWREKQETTVKGTGKGGAIIMAQAEDAGLL